MGRVFCRTSNTSQCPASYPCHHPPFSFFSSLATTTTPLKTITLIVCAALLIRGTRPGRVANASRHAPCTREIKKPCGPCVRSGVKRVRARSWRLFSPTFRRSLLPGRHPAYPPRDHIPAVAENPHGEKNPTYSGRYSRCKCSGPSSGPKSNTWVPACTGPLRASPTCILCLFNDPLTLPALGADSMPCLHVSDPFRASH